MSIVNYSKRIKTARKKLGFTQSQAAKEWGFSSETLKAWEQGKRNPSGLYLEKLEAVLEKIENE